MHVSQEVVVGTQDGLNIRGNSGQNGQRLMLYRGQVVWEGCAPLVERTNNCF